MYVAVPITRGRPGGPPWCARPIPLTTVNHALATLYWRIGVSARLVAVLAALIGLYVSRRISRQMREIKEGAERLAGGRLRAQAVRAAHRGVRGGRREPEPHGRGARRQDRARSPASATSARPSSRAWSRACSPSTPTSASSPSTRRRRASSTWSPRRPRARRSRRSSATPTCSESSRRRSSGTSRSRRTSCMRVGAEDRYLQANGTLLHAGDDDGAVGAVVVLNDVTRLKRLEAVRRDFVANVSHELKTPVTSIKGFAETLEDGALDDPEAARRFVRIIAGQADRLNSIIDDLLALSTLEQPKDESAARRSRRPTSATSCTSPLEVCEPKAQAKRIAVDVACPELPARAGEPAAARAGRRQPRRQRRQVQPRGQRRRGRVLEETRRRDRHQRDATRGPASRASTCRGSSSASTASTRPAAATSAARASGWRSSSTSPRPTAAASRSTARRPRQHVPHPPAASLSRPAAGPPTTAPAASDGAEQEEVGAPAAEALDDAGVLLVASPPGRRTPGRRPRSQVDAGASRLLLLREARVRRPTARRSLLGLAEAPAPAPPRTVRRRGAARSRPPGLHVSGHPHDASSLRADHWSHVSVASRNGQGVDADVTATPQRARRGRAREERAPPRDHGLVGVLAWAR